MTGHISDKISVLRGGQEDQVPATAIGGVLCYGHFNVLHPGHFRYLEYAKSFGVTLSVFVMGEQGLSQSNKPHFFPIHERVNALASLQSVDQVVYSEDGTLADAVRLLRPSHLVLGKEYETEDNTDVNHAIHALEEFGGVVTYHAGETQYAVSLLGDGPQEQEDAKRQISFDAACQRQGVDYAALKRAISNFDKARLLVIGDTIVDQFVACDALGMSAEAPVIVVRELDAKKYSGGAAIVAEHAAALGACCHYLSIVGDDENARWVANDLEAHNVQHHLVVDASRPTTFKIRYMVERQKMFRVSRLKEHGASAAVEDVVMNKISELAPNIDAILVSDFVYGVITPRVLSHLQNVAKQHGLLLFGDVQCSSQVGNVLKFEGFTLLCPTEREARIGLGSSDGGIEWVSNQVLERTGSQALLMKLGSEGFITYTKEEEFVRREHFPALVSNPVDVAGAGDSLLAVLAVALTSGSNIMEASALGANMAALSVSQIGNRPISAENLLVNIK